MNTYQPMMARTAEKPFNDPDWLFEVKWDGIRAIAYVGEELASRQETIKSLSQSSRNSENYTN